MKTYLMINSGFVNMLASEQKKKNAKCNKSKNEEEKWIKCNSNQGPLE